MTHRIRIGIDVGGTFTKAIALDVSTNTILAKSIVPTTHDADTGVSVGIVKTISELVSSLDILSSDIELISHSTTQAINALLESDTSKVGIISMGILPEKKSIIKRTNLSDGNIGHDIDSSHTFLDTSHLLTESEVKNAIIELQNQGAKVLVAAEAFGVEDPSNEEFIMQVARKMNIPATSSHELTGIYGLEIRTLTAVINASVLLKTFQVANFVEDAISKTDISAPLMIMKGDGGATSMDTFRTKPILTILSGPAASVSGALLYLKITNGIFIEVGGTSTNICVIKNGRPEFSYVTIKDHPTCIRSMDVTVLGVAGGSMIQLQKNHVSTVGPRSAHIAGLQYSCFAEPEILRTGKITTISPHDDPLQYVVIECENATYAITNTCAANALDMIDADDYSKANIESAKIAMQMLGKETRQSYSEVALSIIQTSSFEITKKISKIMKKSNLDSKTSKIIGGGGGVSVLVPFVAKQLGLAYEKAQHAEIISSIGVASSMLREEFEYTMVKPTSQHINNAEKQAYDSMIQKGAISESIMIETSFIAEKSLLRVSAIGNVALDSSDTIDKFTKIESLDRGSQITKIDSSLIKLEFESDHYLVYGAILNEKKLFLTSKKNTVLVLDKFGRLKVHLKNAHLFIGTPDNILNDFTQKLNSRSSDIAPQIYLVDDLRVTDYSSIISKQQILDTLETKLQKSVKVVLIISL